jgi:hypothetical protein
VGRAGGVLRLTLNRTSQNSVKKLSEKGSEQRSEHGFGGYSGAKTGRKMPFGCLMRPRPGHLLAESAFYEVR